MAAGKVDLYAEQGATFYHKLILSSNGEKLDLTGQTFRGKIKKKVADADPVLTFTCVVLNQVTNKGEVELKITAADMTAVQLEPQHKTKRIPEEFTYDVERVLTDNTVERVIEGIFKISPEVTT